MRIVAGMWRGRRLIAPDGALTRPTSDRARQALFDMLMHAPWAGPEAIQGAQVLDAFAGTGALGLEALSRGAAHATFMEQDPAALCVLRANIAACRAEALCTVVAADALTGGGQGEGMTHTPSGQPRPVPPLWPAAAPPGPAPKPSWPAKAGHRRLDGTRKGVDARDKPGHDGFPPTPVAAKPRCPCTLTFLDPPYHRELIPQALAALSGAGWIGLGTLIVAETSRDECAPNATPLAERIYGAARITIWRMN